MIRNAGSAGMKYVKSTVMLYREMGIMCDTFQTSLPVKYAYVQDYITAPENRKSLYEEHKVSD